MAYKRQGCQEIASFVLVSSKEEYYVNSLVGRFSLQNVGQFETKILIKLCKLYLMASNNEIFDGIATTRISSTPELSAFIFRKQKKSCQN